MICPEGSQYQNDTKKEEESFRKKSKVPSDGLGAVELNSYRNPRNWKKSISSFFRGQLRSTKSNDGDRPSGSKETFQDKEISPEQKWQSLGKVFRRQSFAEHWNKNSNQGESSSQNKRLAVRKPNKEKLEALLKGREDNPRTQEKQRNLQNDDIMTRFAPNNLTKILLKPLS